MLTVMYLGTGAAVPAAGRDNTSLAFDDGEEITLIDTSGSPFKRLLEAGAPHQRLARVIITHEHPDHSYGFPSLLQSLWLAGRRHSLPVYAPESTWSLLDRLVASYWPNGWRNGFEIERHELPGEDSAFATTPRMTLRSAAGRHSVPCVGIRIESPDGVIVYSSDTSPCDAITELANGASVLIHESTLLDGQEQLADNLGHSTPRGAAQVATAAGVKRLVLVHFSPSDDGGIAQLRAGAATAFDGEIDIPQDGERLVLS